MRDPDSREKWRAKRKTYDLRPPYTCTYTKHTQVHRNTNKGNVDTVKQGVPLHEIPELGLLPSAVSFGVGGGRASPEDWGLGFTVPCLFLTTLTQYDHPRCPAPLMQKAKAGVAQMSMGGKTFCSPPGISTIPRIQNTWPVSDIPEMGTHYPVLRDHRRACS